MSTIALALAGGRGSGKTSVASRVTSRVGGNRASFGEYVRSEARRLGIEETTESLQVLGQRLVEAGPREFAANVLRIAGWNGKGVLIIDGLRHLEILEALRSLLSPVQLRLVLLKVDSEVRRKRLEQRGDDISNFDRADSAPTEVQVFGPLATAADMVVNGSHPPDEIAVSIIQTFDLTAV